MLNKAKSIGEKVDYAALTKSYYARMDKAVTLAVPILTSVIPAIPKMYKFAKTRTGNFKGWKVSYDTVHTENIYNGAYEARRTYHYTQ